MRDARVDHRVNGTSTGRQPRRSSLCAEHEEIITAGQVYDAAPGHIQVAEEDSVSIEFSPADDYKRTGEAVQRHLDDHPDILESLQS